MICSVLFYSSFSVPVPGVLFFFFFCEQPNRTVYVYVYVHMSLSGERGQQAIRDVNAVMFITCFVMKLSFCECTK